MTGRKPHESFDADVEEMRERHGILARRESRARIMAAFSVIDDRGVANVGPMPMPMGEAADGNFAVFEAVVGVI